MAGMARSASSHVAFSWLVRFLHEPAEKKTQEKHRVLDGGRPWPMELMVDWRPSGRGSIVIRSEQSSE